ncbi:unnamed protein product, partial [Discosporangium mesarthrocarpum]
LVCSLYRGLLPMATIRKREELDELEVPTPHSPPPPAESWRSIRDARVSTSTKEACQAWERSLRPGGYYSQKGGRRPMKHRTQAVKGYSEARSWPRGVDGGAWGPQHLSPIPSERDFEPLIPSPTTSPGRRQPRVPRPGSTSPSSFMPEGFLCHGGALLPMHSSVTTAVASASGELARLGIDCPELLSSFRTLEPQEGPLPPPPGPPPEVTLRAAPGFDLRTLRRQLELLWSEAGAAATYQATVYQDNQELWGRLEARWRNNEANAKAAREHLARLHKAVQRLRAERVRHREAVSSAMRWGDTITDLKARLKASDERVESARRARAEAGEALAEAEASNREADLALSGPLEQAETAERRDRVALAMGRQAALEDLADRHFRRSWRALSRAFLAFREACHRSRRARGGVPG